MNAPQYALDDDMVTEQVMLDPEWAERLVKAAESHGFHNRPIRHARVRQFVRLIEEGRWEQNHQGLLIDIDTGVLVDGQHRVLAIIEARMPVPIQVTYAKDAARLFPTVDAGAKKTAADYLTHLEVPYAAVIAAAVRIVAQWREKRVSSQVAMLNSEIAAAYQADSERWQTASRVGMRLAIGLGVRERVSATAAALYLILEAGWPAEAVEAWVTTLVNGTWGAQSPERALWKWVTSTLPAMRGYHAERNSALIYAFVRAWNAHVLGESPVRLNVSFRFGHPSLVSPEQVPRG